MALEYFTIEEFRLLPGMSDATKYPDARVDGVAAFVVERIEGFIGCSFVERTHTEEHDGGPVILVEQPYAREVTALTIDGDVAAIDNLLVRSGVVRHRDGTGFLSSTAGGVSITYTAGYSDEPPGDLVEMAMVWTRYRLLATNPNAELDARKTSTTNDIGGTVNFSVAGKDRPSGYPEIDALLVDWRDRLDVFGFA